MTMTIRNGEWPPNIEEIKKKFNLDGKRPIFCWGNVIYNPYSSPLDAALIYHETTHSVQQETFGGPVPWWDKYLSDTQFLVEQEIPAYRNQFAKFCEVYKDRNARTRYAHKLAMAFSGPMYGFPMPYPEALKLIRNGN